MSNVKRTFDEEGNMLSLLTQTMLFKYPAATLPDIKLYCMDAVGAKMYDRFDANVFLEGFGDYWESRIAISEMRNRIKHEEKSAANAIPMPEEMRQALKLKIDAKKTKAIDKTNIGPIYTIEQYCHRHDRELHDVEKELQGYLDKGWKDSGPYFEDKGLTREQFDSIQTKQFFNHYKP